MRNKFNVQDTVTEEPASPVASPTSPAGSSTGAATGGGGTAASEVAAGSAVLTGSVVVGPRVSDSETIMMPTPVEIALGSPGWPSAGMAPGSSAAGVSAGGATGASSPGRTSPPARGSSGIAPWSGMAPSPGMIPSVAVGMSATAVSGCELCVRGLGLVLVNQRGNIPLRRSASRSSSW